MAHIPCRDDTEFFLPDSESDEQVPSRSGLTKYQEARFGLRMTGVILQKQGQVEKDFLAFTG